MKQRISVGIIFEVDLDLFPGMFYQSDDWGVYVKQLLEQHTQTYNGKVVSVVTKKVLDEAKA